MTLYYYGIDYNIGGLEIFGKNLISFLCKNRPEIEIVILAAFPTIAFEQEFVDLGCTIIHLPNRTKHPVKYSKALTRVLSHTGQKDLLQINACSYRNALLFHAAKRSGIQTIIVGHLSSSVSFLGNVLHKVLRHHYKSFGTKVAVSKETKRYMFGTQQTSVSIITNGIDFDKFSFSDEKRTLKRKELGVADSTLAIAHIGRISKQKNQLFTLGLVKEAIARGIDVKCFFYGDALDKTMTDSIRENQCERIALVPAEQKEFEAVYSAMDIIMVPSVAEGGLSFVAIEAARSGCQILFNENLGKLLDSPGNVHYLPLLKDKWIAALGEIASKPLPQRKSIDLNPIYSLDHSLSKYIEMYDALTIAGNS